MHFRSEVRKFALSVEDQAQQDPQTGSEIQKRHPQPDRVPLLKACDALRNNLAPLGVHIKVIFCPISLTVSAAENLNVEFLRFLKSPNFIYLPVQCQFSFA